ncbi:MAG: 16S rRNA (cytosine(1402)-N(4))-methyltransferase RsmH, partial [Planctomycetales bacterium]|nr:16S rRNA (cytosine(1402)-N(4))-methyltransferase RsmH [Planctomycetales bacterium]
MTVHTPVLPRETMELLCPETGQVVVDGTLGGGGHARMLATAVGPTGRVIAVDRDGDAVERAAASLVGLPVEAVQGTYADLPEILAERGVGQVHAILLDLGLSSDQLEDDSRGFSFNSPGPLDLRFDTTRGEPAWRLLNRLSAEHLADLIYHYGEEKLSRRIARKIVEHRQQQPIETAGQLAQIIRSAVGRQYEKRIDPATRTFQALRIAVNDELKQIDIALRRLPGCLAPGGRMAVISFHSLEDRRVKQAFRADERLKVVTRQAVT